MGTLNLKTWEPSTYRVGDCELSFELKRANPLEAKLVFRAAQAVFKAWGFGGSWADMTEDQKAELVMQRAEAIPEEAREVFVRFVRNVQGLSLNDEPATEGADLFEVADQHLVFEVLSGLIGLSRLSSNEGKGSASPSGSSVGEATQQTSHDSDATSTAVVDGLPLSDATGPLLDEDFATAET